MTILSIDVESRSAADLRKTGAARYFEDPSADVLCAAWCVDDGPVGTWVRGQPCPPEIAAHVAAGLPIAAWNASFEMWGWKYVLGPKHGWPVPALTQWVDTMAQAAAMSIPQSLDGAAQALAMEQQKDKDGMRLIRKFSIPRKAKKGEAPGLLYWTNPEDAPEDFAAFVAYCANDVVVERAIRNKLVPLSDYEQRVWALTLRMNDRGVHLDMPLVDALQRVAEQAKARLDKEMLQATSGAVSACSQVAALTRWLQTQGVDADKLNKNAIEDLLSSDLPEQARRAVELRKEAAKTSTAKLDAMQAAVCRDDRARGLHLYHGAGTGRWSGRLIQTQNMPRGTGTVKEPEDAVDDMLTGDARWIELVYGKSMSAVSDMLRSCITASPGNRLLAADYSSIEGRVTAWLAGEQDEIDAYRANDAGTGAGIYEIAAGGIFNVDPSRVTKPQRQVGKAACVAENTLVLVRDDAGHVTAKPIQYVKITDLTWDGEEWVSHSGVVSNGVQECVQLSGMKLTPDHLIWCGASTGWTPAGRVASSESTLCQASETAKECWPSADTWSRMAVESAHSWSVAIVAGQSIVSRPTTSKPGALSGVMLAPKNQRSNPGRSSIFTTRKSAPTPSIGVGCSTASQLSKLDATYRVLASGWPTEAAVFAAGGSISMEVSATVERAGRAAYGQASGGTRCSSTWSRFRDGTSRLWNLIGLTTTRVTNPETCASLTGEQTRSTDAKSTYSHTESSNSKPRLRVYDLVNAGPRSRFTILSAEGPLIVHNCLALGFGGGVLAFNSMASIYGIDMTPVYPILRGTSDPETFERAGKRYEECLERGDTGTDRMGREAWIASEVTKVLWRGKHPSTVELWRGLEDAAREAVQNPSAIATYGKISYVVRRGFLWCRLPSGRCLAYGSPRIEDRKTPWGDTKPSVTALGVDSVTKRWTRFALYGGLLTENAVQAVARDLMAHGMLQAEGAGYSMVMTVHDEGVADVPLGFGSLAEFEALLCSTPSWAAGLPVVASGWEGQRYRKD